MNGCVSISDIDLLVDKLIETECYTKENIDDLAELLQILKDYNYPLVELADILSIVLMLEYILDDDVLIGIYEDFIDSSVDAIDYILGDKTYLKIEDRIIHLESDFYLNICNEPKVFEERFFGELKKLFMSSKVNYI